jgi:hypothetical protein
MRECGHLDHAGYVLENGNAAARNNAPRQLSGVTVTVHLIAKSQSIYDQQSPN